jgi:hypothetical protein
VWLDLENVSDEPITGLTVRLIPEDASRITVQEPHRYVPVLAPGQGEELGFEVEAVASTGTYVRVGGEWDGAPFHWESPYVRLAVGETVAEVVSLVALGPPYPPAKEPLTVEAIVRAFGKAENLRLQLWADNPDGVFEELASIRTAKLLPGDERHYSALYTPKEKGTHTLYAYLYHGEERIDRRMRHVYVS